MIFKIHLKHCNSNITLIGCILANNNSIMYTHKTVYKVLQQILLVPPNNPILWANWFYCTYFTGEF